MLIVLSPAKTLDFESPIVSPQPSQPEFAADARRLVRRMRDFDRKGLADLMSLSDSLADLNVARFKAYRLSGAATSPAVRPAVLAFDGDVYAGLDARALDEDGLAFVQRHVRILSGLYGVLRPLDEMQPYRLEMGTALSNERGRNLYEFWGDKPARALNRAMAQAGGQCLVNLASEEYFGAVDRRALQAPIIQPVFQERRAKGWQVVSFSAKHARGRMTRFAVDHRITQPEGLKDFRLDGYAFDLSASTDTTWYFRREQPGQSLTER